MFVLVATMVAICCAGYAKLEKTGGPYQAVVNVSVNNASKVNYTLTGFVNVNDAEGQLNFLVSKGGTNSLFTIKFNTYLALTGMPYKIILTPDQSSGKKASTIAGKIGLIGTAGGAILLNINASGTITVK